MAVSTVGIIGAGTMGAGIATNLAQHGLDVLLFDQTSGQVARAQSFARGFYDRAVQRGRMAAGDADAAAARIRPPPGARERREAARREAPTEGR